MGHWSIYHRTFLAFITSHFCMSISPAFWAHFCMRIHPSYIFVITSVRESIHHAFNIAITFDITPKSNRGFPCRDSAKAFVLLCRPFWCFHTQTVVFFVNFSTFFWCIFWLSYDFWCTTYELRVLRWAYPNPLSCLAWPSPTHFSFIMPWKFLHYHVGLDSPLIMPWYILRHVN